MAGPISVSGMSTSVSTSAIRLLMSDSGSSRSPNMRAPATHIITQAGSMPLVVRWWQKVHLCTVFDSSSSQRTW